MARKAQFDRIALWRALVVTVITLLMPFARGAEIITLRSGFTITCISREPISDGTLRLYLPTSGSSATNYIDVSVDSVAAFEAASETVPGTRPADVIKPELTGILQRSGASHNVNVALLASVIQAESAGNPLAVSRSGARGLMQLMPTTALQLGVKESFQPVDNVNGGSAYLDRLLTRYHENIALALAAYNAGPGAVDRYHGIPPFRETQLYVAHVLRDFNRRIRQQTTVSASGLAMRIPDRKQAIGNR